MRTFISFDEARESVLRESRVLDPESCALADALGRTLAEDIVSADNIPPFASSAMDGYAVRAADVEAEGPPLAVVEHIAAGMIPARSLTKGTCARIMTGAPIPEGADAVIQREVATEQDERVVFSTGTVVGKHIRPAAEDVRIGDQVFGSGTLLTPPVIGMLASLGKSTVRVTRKPRVAVITTGDEVVDPSERPRPGQIRNSNGPGLRAQVLQAGGDCPEYLHAPDEKEAIRTAIESNRTADAIIFSGGVSMGDHDHVKDVLEELGTRMVFWKVRQRPGKPLAFGLLGGVPVLGLPGNPVSSAMCFDMYARPLIHTLLGRDTSRGIRLTAVLSEDIKKVENLHYFARGFARQQEDGRIYVSTTGAQGSNIYGSVSKANCTLHLPDGVQQMHAGDRVAIELLPWSGLNPA